jgi:hypothetical protein
MGRQILRLKIWGVKMWNVKQEAIERWHWERKKLLTAKVELLTLLPIATA